MTPAFRLTVPVVLLIFNRPEATRQVFERVREARPGRLFLVADGPRPARQDEAKNCAEVLRVVDQIDSQKLLLPWSHFFDS